MEFFITRIPTPFTDIFCFQGDGKWHLLENQQEGTFSGRWMLRTDSLKNFSKHTLGNAWSAQEESGHHGRKPKLKAVRRQAPL